MSILQEALRRKEAETSGSMPLSSVPPALPPSGMPDRRAPSAKPVVLGLLLGLIVLSLGGYLAWDKWLRAPAVSIAGGEASLSGEPDRSLSMAGRIRDQVTAVVAKVQSKIEEVPVPAPVPESTPPPVPIGVESPKPLPEPIPDLPIQVVERVPAPRPEPVARPSGKWPPLTINGILTLGGKANALINSEVMTVGEELKGVRVIQIEENTVTLLFGMEQKTLRVGQSTLPK